MENEKLISIVIPVFNEEKSLNDLFGEISDVMKTFINWEVIFIDDGSNDESFSILENISRSNSMVKIISFHKNIGKSDALSAGFENVDGDIIITMDADLQDDPKEIIPMINKIEEGWDLVSGWKKNRQDPFSKRLLSKVFNFITSLLTGIKIHDFNCGLKAYRRKVIKSIDVYGGLHRYIPALAGRLGFSVTEIVVHHRERKYGTTKYGTNRLYHGFFDLFTMLFTSKYINKPLHFFGMIGLLLFMTGFIICIYLTIGWFNGIWLGNRPILFLGILLLIIGIQFFSIGLLGELFIKSNMQRNRKGYSTINLNKK